MKFRELDRLFSPLPRPAGPFRVLDDLELRQALSESIEFNRSLHLRYEQLHGYEVIDVHPAALGGRPTKLANKRAVNSDAHRQLVQFWNRQIVQAGGAQPQQLPGPSAPCSRPADYLCFATPEQRVILAPGTLYLDLWPVDQIGEASASPDAPEIFGSDGSGTAFAFTPNDVRECQIYALPFIPLNDDLGRVVGHTVSDLLDRFDETSDLSSGR